MDENQNDMQNPNPMEPAEGEPMAPHMPADMPEEGEPMAAPAPEEPAA